jgi:hypothetical protein
MLNSSVLLHIIPIDGKFFDDPEQAAFTLVVLNIVVLALIIIALASWREGKRAAAKAARAAAKAERAALEQKSPMLSATPQTNTASLAASKPMARSSATPGARRNKSRKSQRRK